MTGPDPNSCFLDFGLTAKRTEVLCALLELNFFNLKNTLVSSVVSTSSPPISSVVSTSSPLVWSVVLHLLHSFRV